MPKLNIDFLIRPPAEKLAEIPLFCCRFCFYFQHYLSPNILLKATDQLPQV